MSPTRPICSGSVWPSEAGRASAVGAPGGCPALIGFGETLARPGARIRGPVAAFRLTRQLKAKRVVYLPGAGIIDGHPSEWAVLRATFAVVNSTHKTKGPGEVGGVVI